MTFQLDKLNSGLQNCPRILYVNPTFENMSNNWSTNHPHARACFCKIHMMNKWARVTYSAHYTIILHSTQEFYSDELVKTLPIDISWLDGRSWVVLH